MQDMVEEMKIEEITKERERQRILVNSNEKELCSECSETGITYEINWITTTATHQKIS